ncbi:MAG: hypothetical protein WGN25_16470 [Candidatus Electrothrix sp. GW3-4]|uniref:hypothetical protein n=1 Tax=Candidatus Electrothrix sp. GW3-4 TaxID=3126740 RepID=UPI0030CDB6FD
MKIYPSLKKVVPADAFLSIVLVLTVIYIFYPGAMSVDSVNQWHEALHPEYISNWYPPSMVYLWSILNKITHGQQGMLIFHNAVYYASLYILGRFFFSKTIHRAVFILFLGLFPPIFFMNGVIWKDVSMLASLSMSIALLFTFETTRNKWLLMASFLFFFYGMSVRHNAIVCVVPYSVYLFSTLIQGSAIKKIQESS